MTTYWHKHPRGFANECTLYRASSPEYAQRLEGLGFTRLTREQARRHIRWLNLENASWGTGRAVGDESFRELTDPADEAYDPTGYFTAIDQEAADERAERAYWNSQARA